MSTIQSKMIRHMNKQENLTPDQKKIRSTERDPEITEIMELADNEAKTAIIKQVYAEYVQGFEEKHENNKQRNGKYKQKELNRTYRNEIYNI